MKTTIQSVALVLSVSVLGACSTTTANETNAMYGASLTDKSFGSSVREARIRQTIDLNAGSKHAATVGTDGQSADAALKRYYKSFEQPKPTFKVLGIGDN